jgi:RNA polymerase sigma-70 factor (ECF subfamily)
VFSEEVAEGVKAGDPDAVAQVYIVLADRLLSYLMARVHDRATAEDLLEATFLELLQKGRTIRGGAASIKVWLFRSAHYNALDHLRRLTRRAEDLTDDPVRLEAADMARGPEDLAVASDTTAKVRRALEQLSSDQRQVLMLRYSAGLSAPEIARVLGKNDGAIRSLQHRGERSLARILKEEERGDDGEGGSMPVRSVRATPRFRARSS